MMLIQVECGHRSLSLAVLLLFSCAMPTLYLGSNRPIYTVKSQLACPRLVIVQPFQISPTAFPSIFPGVLMSWSSRAVLQTLPDIGATNSIVSCFICQSRQAHSSRTSKKYSPTQSQERLLNSPYSTTSKQDHSAARPPPANISP